MTPVEWVQPSRRALVETALSGEDIRPEERLFLQSMQVNAPGPVQARNMAGCELADLVLSRTMGLDVTCSGTAALTLSVGSGDPVQVLSMFRAAVEGTGGTFTLQGSVVDIAFPRLNDRATLVVPGQSESGPVPFIAVGEAGDGLNLDLPLHVMPIPVGVRASEVSEVAALLGRSVVVGTVRGRPYIGGQDREDLRDVLGLLGDTGLRSARVTASEGELPAVQAVAERFGVDFVQAPGGAVLQGEGEAVRGAMQAIRGVMPQPRDLAVSVAFLSMTAEQEADFSAQLSGSVSVDGGTLIFAQAGGFGAVVDGLARRVGATVQARPQIVVRAGEDARFQSGQSVPITSETVSDSGQVVTGVTYRDAGMIVEVRPVMLAEGVVQAAISVEVSSVLDASATNPSFDVQRIKTVSRLGLGDVVILTGFNDRRAERSHRLGILSGFRRFQSDRSVQIVLSVNSQ